MFKHLIIFLFAGLFFALLYTSTSCKHKPFSINVPPDGNYPPEIANIIINKCAIAGCHNQTSYKNANGLLLDSWEHLFDGGNNGAEVVAYSPMYSPLLYIINADSTNGELILKPSMPYSTKGRPMAQLTKDEYNIIHKWIAAGAPDKNGNIPFASDALTRQKIYLTQSGNDIMAVIDGKTKVVMRYIPIGEDQTQIENAHEIEFSDDGKYAYVIFYSGNYIQKIDATNDVTISSVNLSTVATPNGGGWSVVEVVPGDSVLAATNYSQYGGIVFVNSNTMQVDMTKSIGSSSLFTYPHGIASNQTGDTFFVTGQFGNTVFKVSMNPKHLYYKQISVDTKPPRQTGLSDNTSPNLHQIEMLPDYQRYFVACQTTNEVRVMNAYTNKLIKAIPVGASPQEMTLSESKNYLFVTCVEDSNSNTLPGRRGSIYVIDYNTYEVVKVLNGDFYQPHDLCVDEQDGFIYIASTNANPNGPAPHHSVPGGGRPGWYTVFNLNTLQPEDNRRYEVLINPYALNARF